jgi:branched-chain amino acid transport system permease protein
MRKHIPSLAGAVLLIFLLIFPLIYNQPNYPYVMHILITAFFYAILAASWSMLAGSAGQFSFGHMGFMGIGAYSTALLCHYFYLSPEPTGLCAEMRFFGQWLVVVNPIGVTSSTLAQDCLRDAMAIWGDSVKVTPMPVLLGVVLGTICGGIAGFLVGILVLRLRAAYLALFTLGFSEIIKATVSAEIEVTRGQAGLELPPLYPNGLTAFGHHFSATDKIPPYYTMLALLLLCLLILGWLARSKFGLFVRALREDQDAAAALGVNIVRYKVLVFTITTAMAAAAGAVQAHYVQIITPNNLFLLQMSLVVAMAVIGGIENFVAAAIGAIFLQVMLEFLRTSFAIGPVTVDMTVWRLVFFGLLLMITLRFFRNGLIAPLISHFHRSGIAAETVAKRAAATAGGQQ